MSKAVSPTIDTVALLGVCEALSAEYPALKSAFLHPEKSMYPVIDSCAIEVEDFEASKVAYLACRALVTDPPSEEEELDKAGDVDESRAETESRSILHAKNLVLLAEAKSVYENASSRLLSMRKDAEVTFARKQALLSSVLERLRKEFPLPVLSVLCLGATAISPVKGLGVVTPGELYANLQNQHKNRPIVEMHEAFAMYSRVAEPLRSLGVGSVRTWQGMVSALHKVWVTLRGHTSALTPTIVAGILVGHIRKGGLLTKGLVEIMEGIFRWDLNEEDMASDVRTFDDLFVVLQADCVMQALHDIGKAASPVPSVVPRVREVAKKAAVLGTSVVSDDVMPRVCYDFLNSACARGDACRYRHVQVVDSPSKK